MRAIQNCSTLFTTSWIDCALGYSTFQFCLIQDIPPTEQCGHIGLCRAEYRQRNREEKARAQLENYRITTENARRRKQNLPLLSPVHHVKSAQVVVERERNHSRSASRRRSSHSRTRSVS